MASSAKGIGEKYGSSLDSFAKDLQSGVDGVFLDWANVSILIMRKIITRKARTGQASTLASDLSPKPFKHGIQIVTTQQITSILMFFLMRSAKMLLTYQNLSSHYK